MSSRRLVSAGEKRRRGTILPAQGAGELAPPRRRHFVDTFRTHSEWRARLEDAVASPPGVRSSASCPFGAFVCIGPSVVLVDVDVDVVESTTN